MNVDIALEKQSLVQGIMYVSRARAPQSSWKLMYRDESTSLDDRIHHLRAYHVQTLDSLCPISPLDPSALLYSILGVPLPIPTGPQDRTPPISLPMRKLPDGKTVKVDEQSTAAALGYVALILQVLVALGGSSGKGLAYPVTYAGSRSLVKDVTSVMTGPRSYVPYYDRLPRKRDDRGGVD